MKRKNNIFNLKAIIYEVCKYMKAAPIEYTTEHLRVGGYEILFRLKFLTSSQWSEGMVYPKKLRIVKCVLAYGKWESVVKECNFSKTNANLLLPYLCGLGNTKGVSPEYYASEQYLSKGAVLNEYFEDLCEGLIVKSDTETFRGTWDFQKQ